jgi:SAM-dependent methyltransferase
MYEQIEENGRRFHGHQNGGGKYVLPSDKQELDRLDLQHTVFKLTMDEKLFFAPLNKEKIHNILDIGTGTGRWANEIGDEFPNARVIGTDIGPVQEGMATPNVEFQLHDAEDDIWDFSYTFDFVHWRMMCICFKDVKEVFTSAYDNMTPGGWIELQDICVPGKSDDGTYEVSTVKEWFDLAIEAGKRRGQPFATEPPNYERYLKEVGFVNVHVEILTWPLNSWPEDPKMKELGRWVLLNALDVINSAGMPILTRIMGWSPQEVEVYQVRVRRQLKDTNIHGYLPM